MNDTTENSIVAAPRSGTEDYGFTQHGRTGELLRLAIVNALLNLVTLTFYRFWGKTRVRQYLWRTTHFMDEPLEYTGRGLELFLGFLMVILIVLLPLALVALAFGFLVPPDHPLQAIYALGFYPVILFLIGQAVYRARRYRLSRTLWRGIRGGMTGSPHRYAFAYLGYFLLNIFTLGLAYPWTRVRLFGRLMSQTAVGDTAFAFDGRARRLYKPFLGCAAAGFFGLLIMLLASLALSNEVTAFIGRQFLGGEDLSSDNKATLTLAIQAALYVAMIPPILWFAFMASIYRAYEFEVVSRATSFERLSFDFSVTGGQVFRLWLGNMLLVLLTIGIALPLAQRRSFRFFCDHLTVSGEADFEAIRQSAAAVPGIGEGLADAFDMGAV